MCRAKLQVAAIIVAFLWSGVVFGQTNLINPTGDGGFETGTTFSANHWTAVGNNQNQYYVGNAPGAYSGSRCAYISNNSSNWSSANQAAYRHIYRDVAFPSDETEITLSFYYKMNITQSTIADGFTIRLTTTTVTPATSGYPSGVLLHPYMIAASTTWALFQVSIPAENAGTTKRLVFSWYNNSTTPRAVGALDNISLTSQTPSAISSYPYTESFDTTSIYRLPTGWTTQNANTDSNIWYNQTQAPNSSPNAMLIWTDGTSTSNDWLVSPPLSLQSGVEYLINFVYRGGSASYTEKLRLNIASSGTASSLLNGTQLFNNSAITSIDYTAVSQMFTVPASGVYYLGWQAYSAANQLGILVDDVSVELAVPIPGVSETAVNFGVTDTTTGSSAREFRFYNLGYGVLDVQGMTLYGNDSDQFELVDENDYPISLEANEYISVQLYFKPTVVGAKSTTLYVQDNLGKNLYAIPVSGHGAIEKFRDGFENNTNFSLSLNNWTQHDGDGYATYSVTGVSFNNNGYTGSYIAFNPSATTPALSYWDAYAGSKYAACMAASTAPNNDWLISPALNFGNNPVISFYARSITSAYGLERFKVLYSTTGSSYSDFTNYLAGSAATYVEAPTSWTNFLYTLPASCENTTVYIAIQCVSDDSFSFQVDNFVAGDYGLPSFHIDPTVWNFDDFYINYTRSKQFTVTNNGGGSMQIITDGIKLSGSEYIKLTDLPSLPITLGGGESFNFTVYYNSDREGTHSATLSITDNLSKTINTVEISGTTIDNTISQKPYMEGFEPTYVGATQFQVQGWVRRDNNADGYTWILENDPSRAKSGNWLGASQSWVPDTRKEKVALSALCSGTGKLAESKIPGLGTQLGKGAITPDNWLISPPIQITEGDSLSYWVGSYDDTAYAEHYALLVSTGEPVPEQFTTTILEETLSTDAWQYRAFSLDALAGQTVYFAFRHYDCTDQLALRIDDVKIKAANTEIYQDYVGDPVEGDNYFKITMQQQIEDEQNLIPLVVEIEGWLPAPSTMLVSGSVGYGEPQVYVEHAGLTVLVTGINLSGAELRITHNLGFVPSHLVYRTLNGSYIYLAPAQATLWTDTQVRFTVPATKELEGLEIVFSDQADSTLPVELSNFCVTISAYNKVEIIWVSQSETNLLGYRLYRGKNDEFGQAILISGLIHATNTSQQQTYLYEDKELDEAGIYYYWLEHQELEGSLHLHGPVSIEYLNSPTEAPEIPVVNGFASIYPNPFNPETQIKFGLASKTDHNLEVYNLKGQLVRQLSGGIREKGYYTVSWDGRDNNNGKCSSGMYVIRLRAGSQSFTRKAVLAK
jgi:hypothetical protein